MKRFWLLFWLFFLLLHLLTLLLGFMRERSPRGQLAPIEKELVELAELTNDEWHRLGFGAAASEPQLEALNPSDELLQCQALVLQLHEAERALSQSGTEVRITDDLQAWIVRHLEGSGAAPASQYLAGLLDWMEHFLAEERSCDLQRLLLQPDQRSPFPVLSFELDGTPAAMGRSLLAATSGPARWRLYELDLCQAPAEPTWWMRGSCSYDAQPIH